MSVSPGHSFRRRSIDLRHNKGVPNKLLLSPIGHLGSDTADKYGGRLMDHDSATAADQNCQTFCMAGIFKWGRSEMTISSNLFLAILSMDAYNRGYGAGVNLGHYGDVLPCPRINKTPPAMHDGITGPRPRAGLIARAQAQDVGKLERAMRIELTTYSLGSCRSATELRPRGAIEDRARP